MRLWVIFRPLFNERASGHTQPVVFLGQPCELHRLEVGGCQDPEKSHFSVTEHAHIPTLPGHSRARTILRELSVLQTAQTRPPSHPASQPAREKGVRQDYLSFVTWSGADSWIAVGYNKWSIIIHCHATPKPKPNASSSSAYRRSALRRRRSLSEERRRAGSDWRP